MKNLPPEMSTIVDNEGKARELAKLYRASHKTFEDYCRERWGMRRAYADRMIRGASLVKEIDPMGSKITSERQARELAKVPAERRAEVLEEISQEGPVTAKKITEAAMKIFSGERVHVSNNSSENEWYTPEKYIEAARFTMGSIDTDPASSEFANKTVGASLFFTKDENGLAQDWQGNVWLNPPYSQPLVSQFCEGACMRFEAGEIRQACVLVNNATETGWGQRLMESASAICFIKGRVKYLNQEGNPANSPLQGQMVAYFGPNIDTFSDAFGQFGMIFTRFTK